MIFIITAESITVICIIGLLILFNSFSPDVSNENSEIKNSNIAPGNISPGIKADIEVSGTTVSIKEDIFFKHPSRKLFIYIPSANLAKTTITELNTADENVKKDIHDTMASIECSKEQDRLTIKYEMVLDNQKEILSYSDNGIFLTDFLATPAVLKGDVPISTYKSSFGDPYIYDMNIYEITLKVDKSMNIFGPGEISENIVGDKRVATFKASNMRDFPIALLSGAKVETEKHGKTRIYYINSSEVREHVNKVLQFAEKMIGPYPYKELFVVKAPLLNKGMEFSNMVFISDSCFGNADTLKRVTYHEILHQWFYGIIGTDQLDEPFFDEGLVNYLSMYLANDSFSDSYDGRFLHMRLADYSSRDEYYNLAYNSATMYFHTMHKRLGDGFFKILQKIYKEKKNSILYYDDFLKYTK